MSRLFRAAAGIDMRVALVVFLLLLDVWAIGMILSSRAAKREKAWWSVIVILCPIIGILLWYNLGPRPRLTGRPPTSEFP
ncbi:MAG: PLDc N-terminal domain-containing protein [Gemmatimonadota bacterium]